MIACNERSQPQFISCPAYRRSEFLDQACGLFVMTFVPAEVANIMHQRSGQQNISETFPASVCAITEHSIEELKGQISDVLRVLDAGVEE